jgi:hypothetical protein
MPLCFHDVELFTKEAMRGGLDVVARVIGIVGVDEAVDEAVDVPAVVVVVVVLGCLEEEAGFEVVLAGFEVVLASFFDADVAVAPDDSAERFLAMAGGGKGGKGRRWVE